MEWDIYNKKFSKNILIVIIGAFVVSVDSFSQDGVLLSKYGCEGELVKIDCDNSLVIDIVRANYGRLSSMVCSRSLTGSPGHHQDCLHRSSKAVLDRRCGGHHSCLVRASSDLLPSDECPQVGKYLEIHYRCVQDRSSQNRELIPPWLEDLHATYRPVAKTVTQSTTTAKISDNSDDTEDENENGGETNDDEVTRAVIIDTPKPSQNTSKAPPNSQGRYFLIQNDEGESEVQDDEDDGNVTTLIISVSISIVSTLLSVIIIVHICRKVKSKSVNAGARVETRSQSCYECGSSSGEYQLDPNKVATIPVIPIQNIIYAPVGGEVSPLADNQQYNIYSDQSGGYEGGYSVISRPEIDNNAHCDNNVIYRIPEDYIDSNNYMKHNNILHTELYGDRGDIKIMSQSHSLHPLTNQSSSFHPMTNQMTGAPSSSNQMQSLPDLTEMNAARRPVVNMTNLTTMSRQPEVIQRMSPIQILFNDSGQYFVNFNMDNCQNK